MTAADMPAVTIFILTYNSEKYLASTLQSCLDQTYPHVEILICDDGSKDGTITLIRSFIEKHKNIRLYQNPVNLGIVGNLNQAVSFANTEFLIGVGHDDMIPPHHVERMLKWFDADTAFVHCNAMRIDSDGKEIKFTNDDADMVKRTKKPLKYLCFNNFIQSCGLMFRKSAFNAIGGWNTEFPYCSEYDSYVRYAEKFKLAYATDTYAYYRVHETNISKELATKHAKAFDEYRNRCRRRAFKSAKLGPIDTFRMKFKMLRKDIKRKLKGG